MPQRLLGSQEEEILRQSLKRENVILDAGSFITSGGRAEIHKGIDEWFADAEIIVRVARVSRGVRLIADDHERVCHLLEGCRDGFMLPLRKVSQELEGWHISIWEACSGTLEQISRDRKLEPDELVRYLANIAKALDYLAQRSMLHCDVTPRNILIRGQHAVLSDYDLLLERQDNSAVEFEPRGTPGFIAPDFTNSSVFSADLYSFAVCYTQLRTGEHPFAGKDARKDEPNLKKMGPFEREAVAVALAPDHRDRLRFGDRDIHGSWIEKLKQGLKDDGEGLLRSSSDSRVLLPELDVGIHGIRSSGKTTLLGMTFHKNAQRSMESQGFSHWMVVPAKDPDGPGNRTQDYLMEVLDELKSTGHIERTGMSRSFSLRFEVSLPIKKAIINLDDYGGELVQRKDDEFQGLRELAHERRMKLAASDVHLLFVSLDQDHDDVQFAIDKFKGYLSEAGKSYPERPRPVIVVVFTKADLVSEIEFDDLKSVADFRNELMNRSNGDPRFARYKIVNPTRLQDLTSGAVILPHVVSSFGKLGGPGNGQLSDSGMTARYGDLWPFHIWVPFGRAVERALDNVETWFDEQLYAAEQHLGANRLTAALDAMSAVEPKLRPYIPKTISGRKKLERLKAELGLRQADLDSRQAAIMRRRMRRKVISGAFAAIALIATVTVWFNIHAATAREVFKNAAAQIDSLSASEFRQRYESRSQLLEAWFASGWYISSEELTGQRALLKNELAQIEDADFEAEQVAREAPNLKGPMHVDERLARIDKIPTLNGRHRNDYDAWRNADREELYWFNEAHAAEQVLAIGDERPQEVLDKALQYHSDFPHSSRGDEIGKKELAARARLREEAIAAAYGRATSFESTSTSRAATLKSWRGFVEFAGDHKLTATANARIRAIEDSWDSEQYQALLLASTELIAKGTTASRKNIDDFATAQQDYLNAERITKRMAEEVRTNWQRTSRLIDGRAKVTISIRKIWVPYWANFWYAVTAKGDDDTTDFEVRTTSGTKIWGYRIRRDGECTFGGEPLPFPLPYRWGDSCEVTVVNRVHSDQPGTQIAQIPLKTQTGTQIQLRPEVSSEPAATIWFDVSMDEFDLTRLQLPAYRSGGDSR
jgi:serine/threonine protein kinase